MWWHRINNPESCEMEHEQNTSSSSRKPLVIGITGTTNAGKTTLATMLQRHFPGSRIIHQDDFFRAVDDPKHEHVRNLNHHNWDCLSAIMVDELINTVNEVRDEMKNADFTERSDAQFTNGHLTENVAMSRPLLIVEGILVLNIPKIIQACDLKYFMFLTEEECRARRLTRNYDPPDVPGYFEQIVWPNHLYYAAVQLRICKDIRFLNGQDDVDKTFQKVLSDITAASCRDLPTA